MEAVMPEQETVDNVLDKDAHTIDGSTPETDNVEGSIYDNMTAEELKAAVLEKEKGYKELHSKMGQMSGEVGELRKLKERIETDNKLADVLKVATELTANKDKKPEFDYEAWEASLLEEAQENPGLALKKALRAQASWSAQDKAELKSQYEKEMSEMKQLVASLGEVVETTTPEYQQNKELIDKLRDKGMSIKDAKAFAKEIRESMPAIEERRTPPSGISPTRVIAPEKKQEAVVSKEEIAKWESEGKSAEFIETMKWKRQRDANLTDAEKENF